jgi:hypothetical protein
MGFLDKKERILDIVLTDRGRELMSKNQLKVAYYAFSDDGVNYSGSLVAAQPELLHGARVAQSTTTGSAGAGVTAMTASLSSAPQSGSTMIAVVGLQGAARAVSSITQTGATWSMIAHTGAATNGNNIDLWYAPNIQSNAGTSIIVANNGSAQAVIQIAEFRGVLALDKTASLALDTSHPTGSTGVTPTTTNSQELIIAGMSSIANTLHSMSSPYYTEVGSLTGSGVLNASMFQKKSYQQEQAEAIFKFLGAFNAAEFTTSPDAVPVGAIATFTVSMSSSNRNYDVDGHVYNMLTFEAGQKKDKTKTLNTFLYTMPEGSPVLPEFKIGLNLSSSVNLERRFYIETITTTFPRPAQPPHDVVVRATLPTKTKLDRQVEYVFNQKSAILFQYLKQVLNKK